MSVIENNSYRYFHVMMFTTNNDSNKYSRDLYDINTVYNETIILGYIKD